MPIWLFQILLGLGQNILIPLASRLLQKYLPPATWALIQDVLNHVRAQPSYAEASTQAAELHSALKDVVKKCNASRCGV